MPLRVFLSSPGDVNTKRELARRLIKDELPYDPFLRGQVSFDLVSWDDPAAPTPMPAALTPQEAVNRFGPKPSECDIVVVILWSRLGTRLDLGTFRKPEGGPYLSGTEWEFEDAWSAQPRPEILVYRRTEEPLLKVTDPDWQEKRWQYERVTQFMRRFTNPDRSLRGGWVDYQTPEQFAKRLADDLRRLLRERLEAMRVATEKGVPVAPLRAVLARYGERGEEIPDDQIAGRLAHYAEEFAAAREQLERLTNERPEAAAARRRAAGLLKAGELEEAQQVLAQSRQNLRAMRQQTAREEAALLADEARVHRLRLDYVAAAAAFEEAAGLVMAFDPVQALAYLDQEADALYDQGEEFGDNAALHEAITRYRALLEHRPCDRVPLEWAGTQNNLGNALARLGERESGTARLEQAVAAYRAALEEWTRERVPLDSTAPSCWPCWSGPPCGRVCWNAC